MLKRLLRKKNEKGQSLIELAMGMIVLLILLGGIIDLGRVLFYFIAMRDAVEEGAVYGSINPTHCDEIKERVRSAVPDGDALTVTVTIGGTNCVSSLATACTGNKMHITATHNNFRLTMPFMTAFLGDAPLKLTTDVDQTILRNKCPNTAP